MIWIDFVPIICLALRGQCIPNFRLVNSALLKHALNMITYTEKNRLVTAHRT
jgi:hypothetical protein